MESYFCLVHSGSSGSTQWLFPWTLTIKGLTSGLLLPQTLSTGSGGIYRPALLKFIPLADGSTWPHFHSQH